MQPPRLGSPARPSVHEKGGGPGVGWMPGRAGVPRARRPPPGPTQAPAVTIVVGESNQPVQIVMTGRSSPGAAGDSV